MKNGSLREVIKGWRNNWEDHTTTANGSLYRSNGVLYSYGDHFPLAVHVSSYFLVNADRYSNSTSKHQSYTIQECGRYYTAEIPFSALSAMISGKTYNYSRGYEFNARYIPDSMTILDTEQDKWLPTGRYSEVDGHEYMTHVLGGTLFKWNDRYIFSGIDETGIGNSKYFMTELVGEPQTVAEALECMKPQEVKDAEAQGLEVLRQGEWFFVVSDFQYEGTGEKDYHLKGQEGDTGHHFATEGMLMADGSQMVKGIVKHEEKDHKQCKLYTDVKDKKWYRAYHNVQLKSFNAIGNVD